VKRTRDSRAAARPMHVCAVYANAPSASIYARDDARFAITSAPSGAAETARPSRTAPSITRVRTSHAPMLQNAKEGAVRTRYDHTRCSATRPRYACARSKTRMSPVVKRSFTTKARRRWLRLMITLIPHDVPCAAAEKMQKTARPARDICSADVADARDAPRRAARTSRERSSADANCFLAPSARRVYALRKRQKRAPRHSTRSMFMRLRGEETAASLASATGFHDASAMPRLLPQIN